MTKIVSVVKYGAGIFFFGMDIPFRKITSDEIIGISIRNIISL